MEDILERDQAECYRDMLIRMWLQESKGRREVDEGRRQAEEHCQMIHKQEHVLRERITGKLNQLEKTLFRDNTKALLTKPANSTLKKEELNIINNNIHSVLNNIHHVKNINLQSIQSKIISLYNKSAMVLANADRDKRKMQGLAERREGNEIKIEQIKGEIERKKEQISMIYAMRTIKESRMVRMQGIFNRMI